MIKVKYERYLNDFRRANEAKSFSNLCELENWIFSQMQQDYTDTLVMAFPTPDVAKRINVSAPWRIEFTPQFGSESIWIHQIENDKGIIFSDGKFTAGMRHWSKEVQEWLVHCEERRRSPQFNFAE